MFEISGLHPGRLVLVVVGGLLLVFGVVDVGHSLQGDIGFQYASFQYTEPDMELSGYLPGVKGNLDLVSRRTFDVNVTGQLSSGELDYDGETLESDPQPVTTSSSDLLGTVEVNAVILDDYRQDPFWPIIGVGYRYWRNNIRDASNAAGFLREIEYFYLPLGFRIPIDRDGNSRSRLDLTFPYFLEGRVHSYLSDVNASFPDVEKTQSEGSGINVEYGYRQWNKYGSDYNLELFLRIWDIGRSETVATGADIDGDGFDDAVFEPANETRMIGGRLTVNF